MIERKAREIVEEFKRTNDFKVLKQAKDSIERNSQLKRRVEQFSHAHAEVCRKPGGRSKVQTEELEREFDEMMQVSEIAVYFKAGQKFDTAVLELHELIDELLDQALEESNR
ncbi:MAG: hypothetical protein K0Q77_1506 [Anaerosporomusa subterranea]|jgi:cell fate (sporulation/competence/biofilm development) regulator YlbF (YheA/YmcA/DUF963 family)|nr:hypothetical protein [Anaerosporomusa subterranea]